MSGLFLNVNLKGCPINVFKPFNNRVLGPNRIAVVILSPIAPSNALNDKFEKLKLTIIPAVNTDTESPIAFWIPHSFQEKLPDIALVTP